MLRDKTIASSFGDKTTRIYAPSNDYKCIQEIKRYDNIITSICQLKDGTIITCSEDQSICIGDHKIINAHSQVINQVITLPNNRIASCSNDFTVKIWKRAPSYSDIPIKILEGHTDSVYSIIYIK